MIQMKIPSNSLRGRIFKFLNSIGMKPQEFWYRLYMELSRRTGVNIPAEAACRRMSNINFVESEPALTLACKNLIDDLYNGSFKIGR